MKVGYSKTEAERIKRGILEKEGEIEAAAHAMARMVPDHSITVDNEVEALREVAAALKAIVDRRTE